MGLHEGKVFKSGNSAAVRLPKDVAFALGTEVTIERTGDIVTIRPSIDPAAGRKRVERLVAALRAIGPVGEIGPRLPVDVPDRAER